MRYRVGLRVVLKKCVKDMLWWIGVLGLYVRPKCG
jgi:hypothetical protein